MRRRTSPRGFFLALTVLVSSAAFLSSCGGGSGGGSGGHQKGLAAVTACDSNEAAFGTSVKCVLEACPDDCTVFFQKNNTKQEFYLAQCPPKAQMSSQVDIPIPGGIVQGDGSIYCCGGGDCDKNRVSLADNFKIKAAAGPAGCPSGEVMQGGACVVAPAGSSPIPSGCTADSDCLAGNKCQSGSCVPAAPVVCATSADCAGGKKCESGSCVDEECSTDSDCTTPGKNICSAAKHCVPQTCVKDTDCPSGKDCSSGGICEDAGPLAATLTVKKIDSKLGVVEIAWNVTGGRDIQAIQIWSSGFYRAKIDDALPAADACKLVTDAYGKRYLLVNGGVAPQLGTDLTAGSTTYNDLKPTMDTAEKCKDDGSNCPGYTPGPVAPPPHPFDNPPVACRMDLKDKDGNLKRSGTIYTKVLWDNLTFHLRVKDSGPEKLVESTPPVSLDPVELTPVKVEVLSDKPKIRITADAKNVILPMLPIAGCDAPTNNIPDNGKVTGYTVLCPLQKNQDLEIKAQGLGFFGSKREVYRVTLDPPALTFTNGALSSKDGNCQCDLGPANACGDWKQCHSQGDLSFTASATRKAHVLKLKEDGSGFDSVSTKDVPWVKSFEVKASGCSKTTGAIEIPADGPLPSTANGNVVLWDSNTSLKLTDVKLSRMNDHCTTYGLEVHDLDGSIVTPIGGIAAPFPPPPPPPADFQITQAVPTVLTVNDGDDGDCNDSADDLYMQGHIKWRGTRLKKIDISCGGADVSAPQPDPNSKDIQTGDATVGKNPGSQDDDWSDSFICSVVPTGLDENDKEVILVPHIVTFRHDCGGGGGSGSSHIDGQ